MNIIYYTLAWFIASTKNIIERIEAKSFRLNINKCPNVKIGKSVSFNKKPIIDIHPESQLCMGDHVVLNSDGKWQHVAAYSCCHILARKPGAFIVIEENTRLHSSCIQAAKSVKIGKRCLVASNCHIMDWSGHALSFDDVSRRYLELPVVVKPVQIEDDVWLCEGVTILPGVKIGRGTIVAAKSVVTKSLPPYCIAGGNPARIVRRYNA